MKILMTCLLFLLYSVNCYSEEQVNTETVLVTAYCPCYRCCGSHADGTTSTGTNAWRSGIAADPDIFPYGLVISVPGYGAHCVDDTGSRVRQNGRRGIKHIEVRMTYHWEARAWGKQYLEIIYD